MVGQWKWHFFKHLSGILLVVVVVGMSQNGI